MATEPEPQHERTEPQDQNGGDHNEHWDWGRVGSGDDQ